MTKKEKETKPSKQNELDHRFDVPKKLSDENIDKFLEGIEKYLQATSGIPPQLMKMIEAQAETIERFEKLMKEVLEAVNHSAELQIVINENLIKLNTRLPTVKEHRVQEASKPKITTKNVLDGLSLGVRGQLKVTTVSGKIKVKPIRKLEDDWEPVKNHFTDLGFKYVPWDRNAMKGAYFIER